MPHTFITPDGLLALRFVLLELVCRDLDLLLEVRDGLRDHLDVRPHPALLLSDGIVHLNAKAMKSNDELPGGGWDFVPNKFRRGQISRRKNLVGFLKTARKICWEFLVTKFVHRNFS